MAMAMYNITCRYWAVGGGCFADIVNISMAIAALPNCSASVYSPSHLYHPTIHHPTELQRMESISRCGGGGGSSLCTSRFGRHVLGVGMVYGILSCRLAAPQHSVGYGNTTINQDIIFEAIYRLELLDRSDTTHSR
jgi:hypothetical protein